MKLLIVMVGWTGTVTLLAIALAWHQKAQDRRAVLARLDRMTATYRVGV